MFMDPVTTPGRDDMVVELHGVDPEATQDAAFMVRMWRLNNQKTAGVLAAMDTAGRDLANKLAAAEKERDELYHKNYTLRQDNDDLNRNQLTGKHLARLEEPFLLELLWHCFGPTYFNSRGDLVPAVKFYRMARGIGLTESKQKIEEDWKQRSIDEDPNYEAPVEEKHDPNPDGA